MAILRNFFSPEKVVPVRISDPVPVLSLSAAPGGAAASRPRNFLVSKFRDFFLISTGTSSTYSPLGRIFTTKFAKLKEKKFEQENSILIHTKACSAPVGASNVFQENIRALKKLQARRIRILIPISASAN